MNIEQCEVITYNFKSELPLGQIPSGSSFLMLNKYGLKTICAKKMHWLLFMYKYILYILFYMKYIKKSYELINEANNEIVYLDKFDEKGDSYQDIIRRYTIFEYFGFGKYLYESNLNFDSILKEEIINKYYDGNNDYDGLTPSTLCDNKLLYDYLDLKVDVVKVNDKSKLVMTFPNGMELHFYVCALELNRSNEYIKVFYKENATARPKEANYGVHKMYNKSITNIGFGINWHKRFFTPNDYYDAMDSFFKGTSIWIYMNKKLAEVKNNYDTMMSEYEEKEMLMHTFPEYDSKWDVSYTTPNGNVHKLANSTIMKHSDEFFEILDEIVAREMIDDLSKNLVHPKDAFSFGNVDASVVNDENVNNEEVNEGTLKAYKPKNLPVDDYTLVTYYKDYANDEHCEHCNKKHIVNIMVIEDTKGRRYKVGCECVKSLVNITNEEFEKWYAPFKLADFYTKKIKKYEKDGYTCIFLADDSNSYLYRIPKNMDFVSYLDNLYKSYYRSGFNYKNGRNDNFINDFDNDFMKKMLPKYYANAYYVKDGGCIEGLFTYKGIVRNYFKTNNSKCERIDSLVDELKKKVMEGENEISWKGVTDDINGTIVYEDGVTTITLNYKNSKFVAVYDSNK